MNGLMKEYILAFNLHVICLHSYFLFEIAGCKICMDWINKLSRYKYLRYTFLDIGFRPQQIYQSSFFF